MHTFVMQQVLRFYYINHLRIAGKVTNCLYHLIVYTVRLYDYFFFQFSVVHRKATLR